MKFKKCTNNDGTSVVGHVETTYKRLVEVFGKPQFGPGKAEDGDKVTCEWELLNPDTGVIFTIYDYKEDKTPKGVYEWHVGGYNDDALQIVTKAMEVN